MLRRRSRRPDDNRFLPKDAKAWRRLVKAARCQVRAPLASAETLRKASDACGRAVPPPGHGTRDSAFLGLMAMGRLWWRLAGEARERNAPKLGELAEVCAAALDAVRDARPRAPRVDLFG